MPGESSGDPDASASEGDERARDAGPSAPPADAPARGAHPPASHVDEPAGRARSRAREADESARDAGAPAGRGDASGREAREPASEAHDRARRADASTSDAGDRTRRAGASASDAGDRTRRAGASASDAGDRTRRAGASASDAGDRTRRAGASASDAGDRTRRAGASASDAGDRTRRAGASASDAGHRTRRAGASTSDAGDRTRRADAPTSDARPRTSEAGRPPSAAGPPISLADYRASLTRTSLTPEDFRAFLARADTRRWVLAIVKEKVPADVAEDLAQDALTEAMKAFERAPPSRDDVLVVWIATIARRVVADHSRKRGRRRKYEGPMPGDPDASNSAYDSGSNFAGGETPGPFNAGPRPVDEPSYDPREGSVDQLDLKGTFLFRWLEGQVANHSLDRETFEIVLEHGLQEKSYQRIADERGISLTVLSSRIFEFKKKYIPRYKRAKERAVLLIVLFGVAIVAVVVWLLLRTGETPRGSPGPATTPVLDRVLGNPLPVSHPPPADGIRSDAGIVAPNPR